MKKITPSKTVLKQGFLLIEAMMAILFFVMSVYLVGVLQAHIAHNAYSASHYMHATTLAANTIEKARNNFTIGATVSAHDIFTIKRDISPIARTDDLSCYQIDVMVSWQDKQIKLSSAFLHSQRSNNV